MCEGSKARSLRKSGLPDLRPIKTHPGELGTRAAAKFHQSRIPWRRGRGKKSTTNRFANQELKCHYNGIITCEALARGVGNGST
jgi:hypothetical protein